MQDCRYGDNIEGACCDECGEEIPRLIRLSSLDEMNVSYICGDCLMEAINMLADGDKPVMP